MSGMAESGNSTTSLLRSAATIIVLRAAPAGIEVLVTRRNPSLAFMGGMWVFPGGVLSGADTADDMLRLFDSRTAHLQTMHTLESKALPERQCLGLVVAACRETFEECGVLLARHTDGSPCRPDAMSRLQTQREAIAKQPELFAPLLAQENLRLHVSEMVYWAHWITPSGGPRRFDTRFFAVAAPPAHDVTLATAETSEYAWAQPARLLQAARVEKMPVSQPTLYNLEDLAACIATHGSLDSLLRAETSRPVPPVLPKIFRHDGRNTIVMPWDPRYAESPGEGVPAGREYPEALRRLPSWIVPEPATP